ncbi:uncharacterized protein LOC123413249 [Hordeum vulgare subsp. vulgare]|uniref:uncharacterized protein LOC123413249 n=1 Tax=Hordeum vulgare subsp. vulgare TaxID=112509 RepID=UPI001D1A4C2D|nr:uncharacterized protein LOC123413249 [Hordeum vulgare subsp. vulgare]
MDRGDEAMANRWSTTQTARKKWHGIMEEVAACPESGANVKGQMLWMFAMYRADNEDQEFRFLHVFSRIHSCEKWREVRLALDKAKETYNPDAHAPAAAEGRPDGTKKARGGEGRSARCPTAAGFDRAMYRRRQEQCCQEGGEIRHAVLGVDDQRRCKEEEHRSGVLDGGKHVDNGQKGEGVVHSTT